MIISRRGVLLWPAAAALAACSRSSNEYNTPIDLGNAISPFFKDIPFSGKAEWATREASDVSPQEVFPTLEGTFKSQP